MRKVIHPNRHTKSRAICIQSTRLPRMLRMPRFMMLSPALPQNRKVEFYVWEESGLPRPVNARIIRRIKEVNSTNIPLGMSSCYIVHVPGLGRIKCSTDVLGT